MSDQKPFDDEITKSQLWDRIDSTRAAIESHKGEVLYRLDTVVESLRNELQAINSDNMLLLQRKIKEAEISLQAIHANMKQEFREALVSLQDVFKDHLADVEKRLTQMNALIVDVATVESHKIFQETDARLITVEKNSADLTKGLNESMGKFQTEVRVKVGELQSKIERITSKLKDGFQDL